jgi:dTDP-4-dehydrorhamnose reductase
LKLLIIGVGGQLGSKLVEKAAEEGEYSIYGAFNTRPPSPSSSKLLTGSFQLDKSNFDQVRQVVSKVKPDAVIDTGALHNVDYCETHEQEAFMINVDGTRNLARACRSVGSTTFVFVSTDFVFDGERGLYSEDDEPNPLSVYARSKLEGEKLAFKENPENSIVVRPAVIYSWVDQTSNGEKEESGKKMNKKKEREEKRSSGLMASPSSSSTSSGKPLNFGAWLVSQISSGKEVKIVGDQITSPTLADDLAGAILAILKSGKRSVIFHTAGATPLSRYDFSVKLAEKLRLDTNLIHKISSDQLKQVAKRPKNSSLLSDKIKRETGYEMMDIDRALEAFVRVRSPSS